MASSPAPADAAPQRLAEARADGGGANALAGFVSFQHVHLISYVQLADAKAAVFLAFASGAIAYCASHYGLSWMHTRHVFGHSLLLAASTVLLAGSAALAIVVIIPRSRRMAENVVFFSGAAKFHSASAYAEAMSALSPQELMQRQLAYCYDLAKICARKYRILNYSIALAIAGYSAFVVLLLLQ